MSFASFARILGPFLFFLFLPSRQQFKHPLTKPCCKLAGLRQLCAAFDGGPNLHGRRGALCMNTPAIGGDASFDMQGTLILPDLTRKCLISLKLLHSAWECPSCCLECLVCTLMPTSIGTREFREAPWANQCKNGCFSPRWGSLLGLSATSVGQYALQKYGQSMLPSRNTLPTIRSRGTNAASNAALPAKHEHLLYKRAIHQLLPFQVSGLLPE